MTENAKRQTAKIYQFPAGGRAGLDIQNDAGRRAADSVQSAQPKFTLGGGCWYHEAAVMEADLNRTR